MRWAGLLPWWIALTLLLASECALSFAPLGRFGGEMLLLPGVAMAMIVAFAFMRLGRASALSRAFALAAVFWLAVLLCLGSMDAMSRTDVAVSSTQQ